jgi:hypothetical protein
MRGICSAKAEIEQRTPRLRRPPTLELVVMWQRLS